MKPLVCRGCALSFQGDSHLSKSNSLPADQATALVDAVFSACEAWQVQKSIPAIDSDGSAAAESFELRQKAVEKMQAFFSQNPTSNSNSGAKPLARTSATSKKRLSESVQVKGGEELPRVGAVLSTDTQNVGDENSNPILYFSFGRDVMKADWPTIRKSYKAENLIIGGGFLGRMFDDDIKYFNIADEVKNIFVWGIGHDPHKPLLKRVLDRCTLVGVREFQHHEIDNKKVFYVPCASCMSPLFDIHYEPTEDYVFFLHSHSSSAVKRMDIGDAPVMKNRSDFVSTIRFIASGRTVITNSYHGAYYATLLGRKVIVVAEPGQWDGFRPEKFECFKFPPTFASPENWKEAAASARTYPEALGDSRSANISFYERVLASMS